MSAHHMPSQLSGQAAAEAKHAREAPAMAAAAARPRPASGFYGVYATGKRWQAQITYGGKKHQLGTFDTKEQAAHAYDEAAREHRTGALLNFTSAEHGEGAAAQAEAEATLLAMAASAPR